MLTLAAHRDTAVGQAALPQRAFGKGVCRVKPVKPAASTVFVSTPGTQSLTVSMHLALYSGLRLGLTSGGLRLGSRVV